MVVVCLHDRPVPGELGAVERFGDLAAAAAATGREDLVIVAPGVTAVSPDALARLAAAATTTTATVSALRRAAVTEPPPHPVHPAVDAPVDGLVLVPRATLDLVGGDLARAAPLGLVHLLAEDVIAAPAAGEPRVASPTQSLERAVAAADAVGRRPSVTVDGRALGGYRAGTQVHALELIAALARTGAVDVRVLVAHDLAADARELFASQPRISTITYEEAVAPDPPRTDVVHRPSQVFSPDDLRLLQPLGDRLVVTHQDLIAYRTPGYADTPEQWDRLRVTARISLAVADHVIFFSHAARDDALRDELVLPDRSSVVGIGVDHRVMSAAEPQAPAGFDATEPYLLALGADLPHKNLPFAHRLADALGHRLVVAGPGHAGLGQVSEAGKAFLLAHAAAVLYPTLYEGFGLLPFEAAAAGVPCAFAPVSSLAELLGDLATIVAWDVEASAPAIAPLLAPGEPRDAHVAGVREAAAGHTWDGTAAALVDVYARTLERPHTESVQTRWAYVAAAAQRDELGHRLGLLERDFLDFQEQIGEDGLHLVGPHGLLDADDQRALLAVAARPALRRPVLGALRAAYRAAHR